jgi:hemerythrin-like metal-binding protein
VIPSWRESYVTGNPTIDRQHHELLGLVDALESAEESLADTAVISSLLDEVMDGTLSHFAAEESLMAKVGYPKVAQDEMTAQHDAVLPLRSFRPEWLTADEFMLDKRLADFIRDKAGGAVSAPVLARLSRRSTRCPSATPRTAMFTP